MRASLTGYTTTNPGLYLKNPEYPTHNLGYLSSYKLSRNTSTSCLQDNTLIHLTPVPWFSICESRDICSTFHLFASATHQTVLIVRDLWVEPEMQLASWCSSTIYKCSRRNKYHFRNKYTTFVLVVVIKLSSPHKHALD